jgi:hypothetical protein
MKIYQLLSTIFTSASEQGIEDTQLANGLWAKRIFIDL